MVRKLYIIKLNNYMAIDLGDNPVGIPPTVGEATQIRTVLGLGNVNNTSDLDKPISTATLSALNLKETPAGVAAQIAASALTDPQVGNQVGNELVVTFSSTAAVSTLNPGCLVFATSRPNAGTFTVKTSTGYARPVLAATGALSTQVGTGVPANSLTIPIAVGAAMRAMSVISVASGGSVRSGNITEISITNNQGIHSIPTSHLTALTTLNVQNNRITSFDATGLGALTNINLQGNRFRSFTNGTGLSSVTSLDLSNNLLTTFSGEGLSSLTSLNLSNNQLTTISLTGPVSLNYIDLSNNQITSFSLSGVDNNTSFPHINLSGNALPNVDDIIIYIAALVVDSSLGQEGYLDLSGATNAQRTIASDDAVDILILNGWNVITN
jgi:Leucine-rich repeat (LRR) protein